MLRAVVYRGSMAVLVAGSIVACDSESIPDADPVRVEMIGGVETVINTAGYRPIIRWTVDAPRLVLGRIDGGGDDVLPGHLPAFTHIFIDDLDHLWVGRDGDRSRHPATFDILDPDGWFLGRLELPRLRLMQIGPDFVAGVAANDLGVERAVILPLGRR